VILVKGNTEFERYFGDIHREIIEEREKASTADYTAMWWREFERFFVLTFMDKGFDLEMFFEGSFNPHPIDESEVMIFTRKNGHAVKLRCVTPSAAQIHMDSGILTVNAS
jgi:hypothetical protein